MLDSNTIHQSIIELVSNAILIVDENSNIVSINKMAERILGYSREQLIGQPIIKFYSDTGLNDTIKSGEETIDINIDVNGHRCIASRFPIIRKNKIIGAFAIFTDTTTLDNLQEALNHEHAEVTILKTILELAYDGIVVTDKHGKIRRISQAYKQFLGLEEEELIGRHVTDVIENTRMHIVAETGVPEINQLQYIRGNYMLATRIPYFIDGKIAGVIGKVVFRNASEITKINDKLISIQTEYKRFRSEFNKLHGAKYTLDHIISDDDSIHLIKRNINKIGSSDANVLLMGESGTGKELFAHAIHNASNRINQPFIIMNCAAIPEHLLESELFGYEAGAFTGASKSGHMGKFELANHGTLFLDEIGDMPFHMQAKILRVIQENEVERLGSNIPLKIDVRIIAATNKDLSELVLENQFREDLYYRLNVINFTIPPLRERLKDIQLITDTLIRRYNEKFKMNIVGLSKQSQTLFSSYSWPGNVRELKNVIERAFLILEDERYIQPWHLPMHISQGVTATQEPLKQLVEEFEKKVISERLVQFSGNKTKAAKSLSISRVTFHKKLERYGLNNS